MVKIKKETETLEVTNGAFREYFKDNGWEIWDEYLDFPEVPCQKQQEELSEKPLSEMTVAELKAYAKTLGVELKSYLSKEEIIIKIKEVTSW